MKIVNYLGEDYNVEDWVEYIATDKDTSIYGYEKEPVVDDFSGEWDIVECSKYYQINILKLESWKKTMRKV